MSEKNVDSIPQMSLEQFRSIALYATAILFVIFTIACHWFIDYDGQAIRLLVVAGSLMSAAMLLDFRQDTSQIQRCCRFVFAGFALVAIAIWTPEISFAFLAALPICFTLSSSWLVRTLGLKVVSVRAGNDGVDDTLSSKPGSSQSIKANQSIDQHSFTSELQHVKQGLADSSDGLVERDNFAGQLPDESGDQDETDPWSLIQTQFQSDKALMQNVAQWTQDDGARCVVANLRCQFTTADENCVRHLPFWPIMNSEPQVFCRVAHGPACDIKTTHQKPHGLRLEVRLSDRASVNIFPASVIVEVVATVDSATVNNAA